LSISYSYESHETLFIIGEVLNNTNDAVTLVKVSANLFDPDGYLVGTGDTYLWPLDLPAREKGCFGISMDIPADWSYYIFEAPTYYVSATSPDLSIISESGLYDPGLGDYDIIGQVKNSGDQPSNAVRVSGTLFNAYGVPVGCENVRVNSDDLDPGQTSAFSIKYLGYYRDYVDVTDYQLRVAGDLPVRKIVKKTTHGY
jgi:hypothetical protein